MSQKPLNTRVKISKTGRPYVEQDELVRSALERPRTAPTFKRTEQLINWMWAIMGIIGALVLTALCLLQVLLVVWLLSR